MSGPPFPHLNPAPGSNAIGKFVIGVSPIGTIGAFDFWQTILSQYANSPILLGLLQDWSECFDPTADFDNFFDTIFNVDTAIGVGLDIWGRRVGVKRTITITSQTFLGFAQAAPAVDSWGPGGLSPWFTGTPATNNTQLTDEAFRTLIIAKAFANTCNCSIQTINRLLLILFPHRGNCFVTDGLDMTMTYTFQFNLSPVEVAIVTGSGVLPKPAGVTARVVQLVP